MFHNTITNNLYAVAHRLCMVTCSDNRSKNNNSKSSSNNTPEETSDGRRYDVFGRAETWSSVNVCCAFGSVAVVGSFFFEVQNSKPIFEISERVRCICILKWIIKYLCHTLHCICWLLMVFGRVHTYLHLHTHWFSHFASLIPYNYKHSCI